MKLNQKLRFTKFLFFLSILLSGISFINNYYGLKKIYPFGYWKIYTQPLGNTLSFDDYRIYAISKNNDTVRIPNIGYKFLDQDDHYYFLKIEASKIISKNYSNEYHNKRIKEFGEFIAPNNVEYLLVRERFNPLEIILDSNKYQREIIFKAK